MAFPDFTDYLVVASIITGLILAALVLFVFMYIKQNRRISLKGIQKVLQEDERHQALSGGIQEGIRELEGKVTEMERGMSEVRDTTRKSTAEQTEKLGLIDEEQRKRIEGLKDEIERVKSEVGTIKGDLSQKIDEVKIGEETLAEALDAVKNDINKYVGALRRDVSEMHKRLSDVDGVISSIEALEEQEMDLLQSGPGLGEDFKSIKTDIQTVKNGMTGVADKISLVDSIDKRSNASVSAIISLKKELDVLGERLGEIEEEMLGFLGLMEDKIRGAKAEEGVKEKYVAPVVDFLEKKGKKTKMADKPGKGKDKKTL